MLGDAYRNRAISAALSRHIDPDSTVLDIGSGTGVWAILAAKLGAKRVTAVEKEKYLVPIIRTLARENEVSDRIEVIEGDSRELRLRRRFDIIISETFGNQGLGEGLAPIIDARKRFLNPGGLLIPGSFSILAIPAHLKGLDEKMPAAVALRLGYFERLSLNIPIAVADRSQLTLLARPVALASIDLMSASQPPALENLAAAWNLKSVRRVNCFLVSEVSRLDEGIEMKTLSSASWSPFVYPIRPFEAQRGRVEFRCSLSKSTHWTAVLISRQRRESQSYSPLLAYAAIEGQSNRPK
jgi:SAM-dependent methyltransferase